MSAPAAVLRPDPVRPGAARRPERRRGAEAVEEGRADHGLGLAHAAARRVADAAVEALDAPVGQVPLAVLGAALVEPVPGARFDVHDPDDVEILARLMTRWWRRLISLGADLGAPDLEVLRVRAARAPERGHDVRVSWVDIASRPELARWARRAAAETTPTARPGPAALTAVVAALTPDPEQQAQGRAVALAARAAELAAGRPWPPEIVESVSNGSVFSRTEHRPLVWRNGLRQVGGCAADRSVPCVPAHRAQWVCPRCGRVTPVTERVTGLRMLTCTCVGDGIACVHPRMAGARVSGRAVVPISAAAGPR